MRSAIPPDLAPAAEEARATRAVGGFDEPLFRPEALWPRTQAVGRAGPLTPPSWRWVTLGIGVVLAIVLVFLAFASFSRKETVLGRLRPASGEFAVMTERAGTVRRLFVTDGDRVQRGQPLLVVSTETTLGSGATTNARLLQSLMGERDALSRQLASTTDAARLQATENRLLAQTMRAQAAARARVRPLLVRRLELSKDYLDAARILEAKGFVTKSEMKRREEQVLAVQQAMLELDAEREQFLGQAEQAATAALRGDAEVESQRSNWTRELAALGQREVEAELQDSFVLRAPQAGVVAAIQATAGKAIDPEQPLMTILASRGGKLPVNTDFVAELFVPSKSIGFIAPGQEVRMLLDAFPYQQYGPLTGRVSSVSETVLAPNEIAKSGFKMEEPAFLVRVALDKNAAFTARRSLRTGMTLAADLILEKRTLFEWVFQPLFADSQRQM